MNKTEFTAALQSRLNGLSEADKGKAVAFYEEMLSDRMEDGMNEEQAIESLGDVNSIAAELLAEMPIMAIMQSKVKSSHEKSQNKRLWNILAICGLPIWLPFLFAGIMLVFSLFLVVWVLILSCYLIEISFALFVGAGIIGGVWHLININILESLALFSASVAFLGLLSVTFKPMQALSKNFLIISKSYWNKLKLLLVHGKGV